MSFVEFRDVNKVYTMGTTQIRAADGVTFSIEKGEFCVIVGPSGAGKTTVLNMLGGMDTVTEGKIEVDGKLVSSFNERQLTDYRRYDVGFVFQFYNLIQNLTAKENVEIASEICPNPLDAEETLKNAVVEALKRQFLAKAINDAVLYLGEAMQDGVLSDYEKKRFEEMVKEGADKFNMALEGVGDWIKDQTDEEEESDPLTGAVTSMSEETGGVIAGRLNAFVINQSDQIAIMRQNIIYQIQIAQNTKISADELTEIKETLKRIENKDNSLLSQGIS